MDDSKCEINMIPENSFWIVDAPLMVLIYSNTAYGCDNICRDLKLPLMSSSSEHLKVVGMPLL